MSVLDRAIVKAFQRRRDFEAVQQTAAVERCAVIPDPTSPVPSASANAVETLNPQTHLRTPEPEAEPVQTVDVMPAVTMPAEVMPAEVKSVVTVGYTATEPQPVAPSTAPPVIQRPVAQTWQWPEICEQLDQFTGEGFRQLAKHLQFAADEGHKTLAFVSSTTGAGRTSVLLTLTRILALEGRSDVLLIDADRRHPQLASLIAGKPTVGLRDVLHGQIRLDQAVVPMDPGRVAVLPLLETMTDLEWQPLVAPLRALLKQARRDYDMILIDAGVLGPETRLSDCWLRGAADAVITISRQLTGQRTEHDVLDWKQIGIESLGVIETFA